MNDLRECCCGATYECDRCADARLAMAATHRPDLEQDEVTEKPSFPDIKDPVWQRRSERLNEALRLAAQEMLDNAGPVNRVTIALNGYTLIIEKADTRPPKTAGKRH